MDSSISLSPALIASYQEQLKHPHDSRQPLCLGVLITLTTIMTLCVVLRFIARRVTGTKLGWDDAWTLLAYLCSLSLIAQSLVVSPLLRHFVFLTKGQLELTLRAIFASQFIYALTTNFYKAAILHYYLRVFTIPRAVTVIRTCLVIVGLYALICITVIPLECTPLRHAWQLLTPGKCFNLKAWVLSSAIIGIVLELFVFIIPIPLVWNLHLSRSKRFSILGIFFVGSLTIIASIMRAMFIRRIVLDAGSFDPTWNNVVPVLWSITEVSFGTICACLPSIWPLFVKAKMRYRSSRNSSKGTQEGTPGPSKSLPAKHISHSCSYGSKEYSQTLVSRDYPNNDNPIVYNMDENRETIGKSLAFQTLGKIESV